MAHGDPAEGIHKAIEDFLAIPLEEARQTRRGIPPNSYLYIYRGSPEGVPCIIGASRLLNPMPHNLVSEHNQIYVRRDEIDG